MSDGATESFEDFSPEDSGAEMETFDNLPTEFEEDVKEQEEKTTKKEKVKEDLKVIKDSEADSEGKVIKKDSKSEEDEEEESEDDEEEDSEDEESEDEEESDEESEETEEEKEQKKSDAKKLRFRMGGELYNMDSDASFRVKVDGENQDVSIQDLINNYSGKVAWDKKFTDIGKEKKSLEFAAKRYTQEKKAFTDKVESILAPLKDENANPMDAFINLLDLAGVDRHSGWKRLYESAFEEFSELYNMSDVERELYIHKKKDDFRTQLDKKRSEEEEGLKSFNQEKTRIDSLRQTYKVSEDAFADAAEELEALGVEDFDNTDIVEWASLKPHMQVVKSALEPYQENISEGKFGDVVAALSKNLRDGKLDEKTLKSLIKKEFQVEEEVKELNTKVYKKSEAKTSRKKEVEQESKEMESFDDWE